MSYGNYGQQPMGQPDYGRPATDPAQTLGIVGLVLAIVPCTSLIGLIVSVIARGRSKRAGFPGTAALVGIIIGALLTIGGLIGGATSGVGAYKLYQKCQELGPGVHEEGGVTYTCG